MLKVSRVTRAEIADTVDEDRTLRVEATHEDGIAGRGIAVFAQQEGDARGIAQAPA